jgi:hypothetical protein
MRPQTLTLPQAGATAERAFFQGMKALGPIAASEGFSSRHFYINVQMSFSSGVHGKKEICVPFTNK